MAAKIITACVCLHNLARRNGLPLPPQEDNEDQDAQRPAMRETRQEPPHVMPRQVPCAEHVARRTQFIQRNFSECRRVRQEGDQ